MHEGDFSEPQEGILIVTMVIFCDQLRKLLPEDPLADIHKARADVYLADVGLGGVTVRYFKDLLGDTLDCRMDSEADATVVADIPQRVMNALEEGIESDADPVLHNPVTE